MTELACESLPNPQSVGELLVKSCRSMPGKGARLRALSTVLPSIHAQSQCLDIGTAHGAFTYHFAKEGSWTYVDKDPENHKIARTILQGKVIQADAIEFLKENQDFFLITCLETIFYFEDTRAFLKGVWERLTPGGYLVLSARQIVPADWLIRLRVRLGVESAIGTNCEVPLGIVHKYLAELGFRIEKEVRYLGPFSNILQTCVDLLNMRSGKMGDRLTFHYTAREIQRMRNRAWLSGVLSALSTLALWMDELTPFFPRYGYMLRATKP